MHSSNRPSADDIQQLFLRGWIQSGADPAKCPSVQSVISTPKGLVGDMPAGVRVVHTDKRISDYDDSPQALDVNHSVPETDQLPPDYAQLLG